MSTFAIDPYLRDLGFLVAEHGIAGFEGDIARLVVRLRAEGYRGTLLDLLADPAAPATARERAFGIALGAISDGRSSSRIERANDLELTFCLAA